jgi:hypothetical protein
MGMERLHTTGGDHPKSPGRLERRAGGTDNPK